MPKYEVIEADGELIIMDVSGQVHGTVLGSSPELVKDLEGIED